MSQASYMAVLQNWWSRSRLAHQSGSRSDRRRLAAPLRRARPSFVKRISSFGGNSSAFSILPADLPAEAAAQVGASAQAGPRSSFRPQRSAPSTFSLNPSNPVCCRWVGRKALVSRTSLYRLGGSYWRGSRRTRIRWSSTVMAAPSWTADSRVGRACSRAALTRSIRAVERRTEMSEGWRAPERATSLEKSRSWVKTARCSRMARARMC